MPRPARIAMTACLVALLPFALAALEPARADSPMQGKSGKAKHGKAGKAGEKKAGEPEFSVEFLIDFSSDEARRIAVESKLIGLKPLPPGIRKNLARGKPLPPGIAKQTLPEAFVERLPAHDDYLWRRAGTDLVLIARSDKLVVEIAADIFD